MPLALPTLPLRTAELLARNADKDATDDASRAASAVRALDVLGDADVLVILAALSTALRRSRVHDDLSADLEVWVEALDEALTEQRAIAPHEPDICLDCNGSGEGRADGTTCRTCRGEGEV